MRIDSQSLNPVRHRLPKLPKDLLHGRPVVCNQHHADALITGHDLALPHVPVPLRKHGGLRRGAGQPGPILSADRPLGGIEKDYCHEHVLLHIKSQPSPKLCDQAFIFIESDDKIIEIGSRRHVRRVLIHISYPPFCLVSAESISGRQKIPAAVFLFCIVNGKDTLYESFLSLSILFC